MNHQYVCMYLPRIAVLGLLPLINQRERRINRALNSRLY